jgi:hypothetical protein
MAKSDFFPIDQDIITDLSLFIHLSLVERKEQSRSMYILLYSEHPCYTSQ